LLIACLAFALVHAVRAERQLLFSIVAPNPRVGTGINRRPRVHDSLAGQAAIYAQDSLKWQMLSERRPYLKLSIRAAAGGVVIFAVYEFNHRSVADSKKRPSILIGRLLTSYVATQESRSAYLERFLLLGRR